MSALDDLVSSLKFQAQIEVSEGFTDDNLEMLIGRALSQHNVGQTADALPLIEYEAVTILAAVKVCYIRANRFAQQSSLGGASGYSKDEDSPFYKCIALAKSLLEQYKAICADLNLDSAGNVTLSQVTTHDDALDAMTPLSLAPPPPPLALALNEDESGDSDVFVLSWTMKQFSDFRRFSLFHNTEADPIFESTNWNSSLGVPQISDNSALIADANDQRIKTLKVTGVDKSIDNRFLVVATSNSGQNGYSNELVIEGV